MARFKFVNATTQEVLEETEMVDCHTVEQAIGTRYGSALPADGLEVTLVEDDFQNEGEEHGEAVGTTKHVAKSDQVA